VIPVRDNPAAEEADRAEVLAPHAGVPLEGVNNKKPTARFTSRGGLETFSSLLSVSPRAGSEDRNGSRSRRNRRNRLGRHSLSGGREHYQKRI